MKKDNSSNNEVIVEINERLQVAFESSRTWIETILLSVAFVLVALASKAPDELEIIGVKFHVEGDYRNIFLIFLAIVLLFRLIEGWILSRLFLESINAQMQGIVIRIIEVSSNLMEQMESFNKSQERIKTKVLEFLSPEVLGVIFDLYEVLHGHDSDGVLNVFSSHPNRIREEANKLVETRWTALSDEQKSLYPRDLWNQAARSAVDLIVDRSREIRENNVRADSELVSTDQEKSHRAQLDEAIASLTSVAERRIVISRSAVDSSITNLASVNRALRGVLKRAYFYRSLIIFKHYLNLVIPTIAVLIAFGMVAVGGVR